MNHESAQKALEAHKSREKRESLSGMECCLSGFAISGSIHELMLTIAIYKKKVFLFSFIQLQRADPISLSFVV